MACFVRIIVIMVVVGVPVLASAEKIYKYKTDSGSVLFTNKSTAKGELLEVRQAEVYDPINRVTLDTVGGKDKFKLTAYNEYYGPVEVTIRADKFENMACNYRLPCSIIVEPRRKKDLVSMWVANPKLGYAYTYTQAIIPGDPSAVHDDNAVYQMPISPADAGSVRISQGFNTNRTHNELQSLYAIDIPATGGTLVRAARGGIVMDVANDFFRSGKAEKYKGMANYVRILHNDGTMALYAHLQLESAQVKMGQQVNVLQPLGRVGSTGFSEGPHLHYVVQKNFGGELRSIPFRVAGPNGIPSTPVEGMQWF